MSALRSIGDSCWDQACDISGFLNRSSVGCSGDITGCQKKVCYGNLSPEDFANCVRDKPEEIQDCLKQSCMPNTQDIASYKMNCFKQNEAKICSCCSGSGGDCSVLIPGLGLVDPCNNKMNPPPAPAPPAPAPPAPAPPAPAPPAPAVGTGGRPLAAGVDQRSSSTDGKTNWTPTIIVVSVVVLALILLIYFSIKKK